MPNTRTIKAGNRNYVVTTATANVDGWPLIEVGPAGTTTSVSTLMIQFTPSEDFVGNFVVMGRTLGQASQDADIPFAAIPYRRISLNGVAQDYALVNAPIAGAAIIQVPANGLTVVLTDGLTAGKMTLTMWDLAGSSAI